MKKTKWVLIVLLMTAVLAACIALRMITLFDICAPRQTEGETMEYVVSSCVAAPEFSVESGTYTMVMWPVMTARESTK